MPVPRGLSLVGIMRHLIDIARIVKFDSNISSTQWKSESQEMQRIPPTRPMSSSRTSMFFVRLHGLDIDHVLGVKGHVLHRGLLGGRRGRCVWCRVGVEKGVVVQATGCRHRDCKESVSSVRSKAPLIVCVLRLPQEREELFAECNGCVDARDDCRTLPWEKLKIVHTSA